MDLQKARELKRSLLPEWKRLKELVESDSRPLDVGEGYEEYQKRSVRVERVRNNITAKEKLASIEEVLKRPLKLFGICKDCEEEIEEGRISAYPNVGRCRGCQDKYDKKHPRKRIW